MKGRPPAKGTGPRKPGTASPGRARGAAKAARARKPDAPGPAAQSAKKALTAKAPSVKASAARPAAKPASSSPAKGVSLDVRQFRVAADDDGIRLDRWFQRHLPDIGFNSVSRWARTGQLRVDGARAAPGDRVAEGQTIRVPPAEPKAPETAKPKRARPQLTDDQVAFAHGLVIHRDAQAIVINKPPGLATQGGTKTDDHVDGLLDALEYELDQRPKLVHRTRTRPARCSSRAPRGRRRSSPRRSPAARRARSIGPS